MGFFKKLKSKLDKSSTRINEGLKDIFVRSKLDDEMIESLEELLISSDLGLDITNEIITDLTDKKYQKDILISEVKDLLALKIKEKLAKYTLDFKYKQNGQHLPQVILMCGVNGAGKTTTIGKLAYQARENGKKVLIAACDTFRAAAVEQLEVWTKRAGAEIITAEANSDPASVAFTAYEKAIKENYDLLFIDTAGRLQNKTNLMEQLAKIVRVLKKKNEDAPHEVILVLDATTGQNAISQAQIFKDIVNVTGLVMTKLDGTAKGGILLSVTQKFDLPIHAVGVGEQVEDLRLFTAEDFAKSLLDIE